jgi:hypothetical protein
VDRKDPEGVQGRDVVHQGLSEAHAPAKEEGEGAVISNMLRHQKVVMNHIPAATPEGLTTFYVRLLDEDIDAWRPVHAEALGGSIHVIAEQEYARDLERWEFEPGDHVVCETRDTTDGSRLVTVRSASEQPQLARRGKGHRP